MHGDEHVARRKVAGVVPYRHHGTELPDGRIAENCPPGVRVVSFSEFARGGPTTVISRGLSPAERDQVVERALSRVGERGWCATGVARSQQVADVAAAVIAFLKAVVIAGAAVLAAIVLDTALAE
jgi:hypothetical protein